MGFLKSRLTANRKGSPFASLLSLLGMKDEVGTEKFSLSEEIELFAGAENQEVIYQMINSYESGDYLNFYKEYHGKLPLASVWGVEDFQQRSQRGSLVDLLIVWSLISMEVLYDLKWKQKRNEEELISFIDKRIRKFYKEEFSAEASDEKVETEEESDLLCLLEKLDRNLISHGYRLLYFGVSGEEYYVGVFDQKTADRLVGKSFGIVTLYPCSD